MTCQLTNRNRQVCKSCNGMFDDQGTFYAHEPCLQSLSLVQNGEYRCQVCNRLFNSIAQLRMHCTYHGVKRFRCRTCASAYHAVGEIRRHVPVHAELHPCGWPACPKKFTTLSARQQHYDTAHINRLPYVCEVCSFGFLTHSLFQKHNATRHAGKVTPASSFSSSKSLPSSSSSATGVLAIEYQTPAPASSALRDHQTAMKSTSSLTRSPVVAAGIRSPHSSTVRSNITTKRFSQIPNDELDKHFVFICPKRKCNTCRTTFMDPTKHAVHEPCFRDTPCYRPNNTIMHRYGCPLCSREAEKMGKLRDHMFMHFENVLKCNMCGCRLPSLRVARKHVAGHLESSYTCNIPCRQPGCTLFFHSIEERLRHMEQNHRRTFYSLFFFSIHSHHVSLLH